MLHNLRILWVEQLKKCWTHITSDSSEEEERKITFCSFSFHSFLCNKKIEIKREMSADYRKSYLWAKKYLLKIANFSILIVLLKFSFFFDITAFTAYGIRMKSGAHIIKEKFSALCIHCGKNYYFSFYYISFIYDICIWRNCLQPYLVHFYNAFPLYVIIASGASF